MNMHGNNRAAKTRMPLLAVAMGLGVCGTTALAWAGSKLVVNGKVASTDVRTVGGRPYVSLADMAKAMGMVVVKRGNGYEIKKAGGATPIKGIMQGKVGDVLFDGRWRFKAVSVQQTDSYVIKTDQHPYDPSGMITFDDATRAVKPKEGNTLVVAQCRVTNATNTQLSLWTAPTDSFIHNALADMGGTSHPPLVYDYAGGPIQTPAMVPGGSINFAVIFSVPQGTRLNALIFTLKDLSTQAKGNDVRVSLK